MKIGGWWVLWIFFTAVSALSFPALLRRMKRGDELSRISFKFNCRDRPIGFYADTDYDCRIFHMCINNRRIPHMCGNRTSFNQQYRVCDWNYNVDCEDAPNWYYLNELTYVTEPPRKTKEKVINN